MNEFKTYTSADSIFAEVTEIKWKILNPTINDYVLLNNDLLDTKTTQVTLRYQFVTDCESSGTSKETAFSISYLSISSARSAQSLFASIRSSS